MQFTYCFRPVPFNFGRPNNGKHFLSGVPGTLHGSLYNVIANDDRWVEWNPKIHRGTLPHFTDIRHKFPKKVLLDYLDGLEILGDKVSCAELLGDTDFMPETWIHKAESVATRDYPEEDSWYFIKPADGYGGHAIQIVKRLSSEVKVTKGFDYIIQRAVTPKLTPDGRKFDWRFYVAVSYDNNTLLVDVYEDALIRSCVKKYIHPDEEDTVDQNRHITNFSHQKIIEGCDMMKHYGLVTPRESLRRQAESIVRESYDKVIPLCQSYGAKGVTLTAFDLIEDVDGKLWLLEFNRKPGLAGFREILKPMMSSMLYEIVLPLSGHPCTMISKKWFNVIVSYDLPCLAVNDKYVRKPQRNLYEETETVPLRLC